MFVIMDKNAHKTITPQEAPEVCQTVLHAYIPEISIVVPIHFTSPPRRQHTIRGTLEIHFPENP